MSDTLRDPVVSLSLQTDNDGRDDPLVLKARQEQKRKNLAERLSTRSGVI